MQVICLEEAAFYALIEQVVARLREQHGEEKEKWISDVEVYASPNRAPVVSRERRNFHYLTTDE